MVPTRSAPPEILTSTTLNCYGIHRKSRLKLQEDRNNSADAYEARRHALFFTDPGARKLYRAHAAAIAGRNNSITGRMYKDDPTIMAWSLINEPRCASINTDGALHGATQAREHGCFFWCSPH